MKKLTTLLTGIVLTTLSVVANAQTETKTGKASGSVTNASKPIESAAVSLVRAKDSTVIKMRLSDKEGHFDIDRIANGNYLVLVEAFGFSKYYSEKFAISDAQNNYTLKKVNLIAAAKNLNEVTVTSQKKLVEQKIDRMVVNVDASTTNVGATALEVLEKSPGISVDKDGNVSLKGKQGVVIMIDGKPSYLSGADLANLLRNMSAAQLEQIEIMTNPPAKYDAAGNSGVINIKTKKSKVKGLNGSITLGYGQGVYPKSNESLNINYRSGKWNLFSNYSFNYRDGFQQLNIIRNFRDKTSSDLLSVFDQSASMRNTDRSHNLKLGADFYASKNTTYGVVLSGFDNIGTGLSDNNTKITDKKGGGNSITQSFSTRNEVWKNGSINANFKHGFDTAGREITADVDYIKYDASNFQPLFTHYFDGSNNPTKRSDTLNGQLPTSIDIYSVKADYTHPLKKGGKLEAGFKVSYVETDNNAKYDSIINNAYVPDYNRSNHFIYKENINAGYINYSKEFSKKWSVQLGLRVENTHAKGNQLGNAARDGSGFDTSYTQFFPTAYVGYSISQNHQVSINYGRRIERPSYEDLNPFVQFLDKYTYQQGNPYLRPQFSHNIELNYTYMSGLINTTLNYTAVNNIIQQVIQQNSATNETYIKQANIAKLNQIGFAVSSNIPIKKWWNVNLYANVYNNRFRGTVNDTYVDISANTLATNITSSFKFNKGWGAEINGFYQSNGVEGVILVKPMGMIGFGASKNILKNKGSLRLNIRDPFKLQYFRGSSKYGDVDAAFVNHWDNRTVTLSFTYRFSKGTGNAQQRQRGKVDEQNRVKVGGN